MIDSRGAGIKHKRLGGQSLGYKNICTKILNELEM